MVYIDMNQSLVDIRLKSVYLNKFGTLLYGWWTLKIILFLKVYLLSRFVEELWLLLIQTVVHFSINGLLEVFHLSFRLFLLKSETSVMFTLGYNIPDPFLFRTHIFWLWKTRLLYNWYLNGPILARNSIFTVLRVHNKIIHIIRWVVSHSLVDILSFNIRQLILNLN